MTDKNVPAMGEAGLPWLHAPAVAVLGGILLLVAGDGGGIRVALATLLAVAGVVAGRLSLAACRRHIQQILAQAEAARQAEAAARAAERREDGLDALCRGVLPVWARQIDAARRQTEDAITSLSGRFAGIAEKLEAAEAASRAALVAASARFSAARRRRSSAERSLWALATCSSAAAKTSERRASASSRLAMSKRVVRALVRRLSRVWTLCSSWLRRASTGETGPAPELVRASWRRDSFFSPRDRRQNWSRCWSQQKRLRGPPLAGCSRGLPQPGNWQISSAVVVSFMGPMVGDGIRSCQDLKQTNDRYERTALREALWTRPPRGGSRTCFALAGCGRCPWFLALYGKRPYNAGHGQKSTS